jgi:hypothetical protein
MEDAFSGLACLKRYEPDTSLQKEYQQAYSAWKALLEKQLKTKH